MSLKHYKEETLCAWCGTHCDDCKFIYNGEVICLQCYEEAVAQRIEDHNFWEGVRKKCQTDG